MKYKQAAEKGRGKKSNRQVGTVWIPLGRKPNVDTLIEQLSMLTTRVCVN